MLNFDPFPSITQPAPLQAGDKIGIVSVAGKVAPERVEKAIEVFKGWGLEVVVSKHAYDLHGPFAGIDRHRREELQAMIDDPEIQAIISTRGGYGTSRIIDAIDFSGLLREPKWLIGFSDLTVLHCHLNRLGLGTLHAAMPVTFTYDNSEESIETLRRALFGETLSYSFSGSSHNRKGQATGQFVGGNLSLLVHLIGTPSELETAGKILFLEDIGEYLYHIDRMMIQMKRSGNLAHLAGLVVGQMTDMQDRPGDTPFGKDACTIIAEAVADYSYPVCFGLPAGHESRNWALPLGKKANLNVSSSGTALSFLE